ncbi:MAG: hypothetical protein ACRDGM_08925, partial [bacterium]
RRVFEGRFLPSGAEAAAWLREEDMRHRIGFAVGYQGWRGRYRRRVEVDFDVRRHSVDYIMVADAPARFEATVEDEVHRPEDQVNDGTPGHSKGKGG